jgi:tRNA (guanine37-N1)-methyltransferase
MLTGELAEHLASLPEITILCGHYEGVDQRALDMLGAREVSIGDYVLTGGELPAMVLIDTVARFIDGVLAGEESVKDESVYSGLLEYPHYSKPRDYEGAAVPEILLSGNHGEIDLWRWEQSLALTKERRPDLFAEYMKRFNSEHTGEGRKKLSKRERAILDKYR